MYKIVFNPDQSISAYIDTSIYGENIISKALYWFPGSYIIYRKNLQENLQEIIFKRTEGSITQKDLPAFETRLCQELIDYKNREIINNETKDIRNILYVKAFANNDEFIEFDFSK